MSDLTTERNGRNTDKGYAALFDIAKVEASSDPEAKAVVVKLSPTTDLHAMITEVNKTIPHLKPTAVARLLLKVGYAAFVRSSRERGQAI